jgi:hypothetical protein
VITADIGFGAEPDEGQSNRPPASRVTPRLGGKSRPGLVSLDVTVSDPVPPQFFFRDLDGNRFLIVEPG